ncbi:DUF6701 domain-containing protein [Vibrio salilacus]|uniref:DUF6701 domain-containing protein n=1 Tax=Vibrio salilacus TaxID=1323749 RepID=UPI000C299D6E|nr:DUF6701 domain-containing protein [Vibrio salilacus]
MNRSLVKTLVGCLVLLPACAWSFQNIDQTIYFPSVAQGHGSCSDAPNPQFTQNNSAKITGTGGQALAFCSSNLGAGLPSNGCDGQQCVVTGSLSTPSLSLTGPNSFPNWNSNENIGCSTTQSTSINTLNQVNLTSGCELTFLPNNNGYRIKNFQLNQNAKAILTSGDYWFESANFVQNSQLVIDGDVRIFILGNTEISGSQLNATSTGNLTIVAYGSISLNNQSIVNGYIYAADQLTLNNNSVLNGRVTAKQLTMSGSSRINQFEQQGYTCFSDDFNRSSLGQSWVPFTSTGNFTPRIVSDRLRLTEAIGNQATAVTYQRIFPAAGNLVTVEFDYYAWANLTGNGADGVSVIFSDAEIIPRTGGFGGSLGYAPTTSSNPIKPGFAGGWLGVGLDEWGNYSNPTEGRVGGPGFRRQAVAIRGSEAASYRYLVGTAANLNPKLDVRRTCQWWGCSFPGPGPGHRYFITIDSRNNNAVYVRVDRLVNGNMQTVIDWFNVLSNPNQGATPEEFLLSLAGSTGGSVNNHEIENFKVCALKSRDVGEQVDHFRIAHSGQEPTCSQEEVVITACMNATCSEQYTGTVTATLSPASITGGGGWVGGNVKTFSGGSGTFFIRKNQPGIVTLDVSGSTPTARPFSENLCSTGNGNWSADNCDVLFTESGFLVDVPDKYAAEAVTATIKAVQQGSSADQCVARFANQTKSVDLWSQYIDPAGAELIGTPKVSINASGTEQDIGDDEPSATNFSLDFDSTGQASVELNYDDAGHVQLNATFIGTGDEQELALTGSANFVSFPKYLTVTAENSDSGTGSCSSADTNCDVFAKAGEEFTLKVTAYNQEDDVTPNYKHSGITISHSLVEPSTGSEGSITATSYNHAPILNGTNSVTQSVSEVGVFDFTAEPQAPFYGSTNREIALGVSGNIGRFIPAYLAVSKVQDKEPKLEAFCGSFNYIGQPFGYSDEPQLALNPKTVDGSDISNYLIDDWWRYNNDWGNRNYLDANGVNISLDTTSNPAPTVVRVQSNSSAIALNNEVMVYDKPATPINPFTASFQLVLDKNDLKDSDGVCFKTADSDQESDCQGISFDNVDASMQLRWGRLVIHDTYGSDLTTLRQKLAIQQYKDASFETNIDDSCTNLGSISSFELTSDDYTVVVSGNPTQPEVNANLTSSIISRGESWIEFSPPGAGNNGSITTTYNMSTQGVPWLREDKDDDGDLDNDNTEEGRVQFGLYRGSDRVIWWRENSAP